LAYLFIKTGRLWVPIGIHITWNITSVMIFGMAESGVEVLPIFQTEVTGSSWLTGGVHGVANGAIYTIVTLFGLAYVHFCVKHNKDFWQMDGRVA